MALYEQLKAKNIIPAIKGLLKNNILEIRKSDGKIIPSHLTTSWDIPWIFHRSSFRHNCFIWKDIVFENVQKNIIPQEKWFVPSSCIECFKVVVRPRNLGELLVLESIQYSLDHPSKCGLETRYSVFGNYGGYFYNRGLEEGLECYDMVRKAVDKHIGKDVPVLLKRGCTEYEHGIGPSDQWVVTEEQEAFEELVEARFVMDVPVLTQPRHVKYHVKQRWIEEAWKIGDETVHEFIDKPLYPPYVTYHEQWIDSDLFKPTEE